MSLSVFPAIIARLAKDAAITAMVEDRIYSFTGDQNSPWPDLVVFPTVKTDTLDINGSGSPYFERISIECRGKTARSVDLLGREVRRCLQNATFFYRSPEGDTFNVHGCIIAGDVFPVDEEWLILCRIIDFRVSYTPGG